MNMYLDLLGFGLRICLAVLGGTSFSFLSGTGWTDIDMRWIYPGFFKTFLNRKQLMMACTLCNAQSTLARTYL